MALLVPRPSSGSTHRPQFRFEPAILFVDESGLLQAPQGKKLSEIGTLGGLLIPDTETDRTALQDLLKEVRLQMFGDPLSKNEIKAKKLGDANYALIADAIRQRWVFVHQSLPYGSPDIEQLKVMLGEWTKQGGLGRDKLSPLKNMDIRLDFLERQIEKDIETFPLYISLLFKVYLEGARWFRKNGIFPKLTVWLDDKLPRAHTEFVGFLGRFSIFTQYPEMYSKRLGEMLGVDPSPNFACHVDSDANIDGLVIADAIAYAGRKVAQRRDKDGRYQKILDRMNIDKPLPTVI